MTCTLIQYDAKYAVIVCIFQTKYLARQNIYQMGLSEDVKIFFPFNGLVEELPTSTVLYEKQDYQFW